jgi:alkylation response protein AidB-like acyl-CoA dehydrogenase
MDRTESGRAVLRRWEAGKPADFYEDDEYLRVLLARRLPAERLRAIEAALHQAGADSAGPISRAASVLDRPEHLPRLERWSATGDRTEEIVHHPDHHAVGRLVWRSGVLGVLAEPGSMTEHAALAYLFALNGEVPHLCSLACTAGLIKVIQRAGTPWMRRTWLPRLLERDYDRRWHGAQFLTEVQGGSDVGANECVARPVPGEPGCWAITGEKWFCSNVGADLYALSARPEGGPDGTPGIALFVVPRHLESGEPNGVFIRRLKNKLGTRTLPTAEVDFQEARAWPVGDLGDGFRLLMGVVINTSRLEVAIGSCGIMRRAWVEAFHYARAREAFGRRLVDFPAVRQQLAEMRALGAGGLALTLWTAALEDRLVRAGARPEEDALFRTVVNVNKYVCSTDAGLVVHHAIEVLGGNGTIEDFSPLPRLYREVPVQESWEGPHNTLMAQLLRDALRGKMHAPLFEAAQALLIGVSARQLVGTRDRALAALEDTRGALEGLLRGDPQVAALHVRTLLTRAARVMQAALLLEDAQRAAGAPRWLAAAADLLVRLASDGRHEPALDADYPAVVEQLVEG